MDIEKQVDKRFTRYHIPSKRRTLDLYLHNHHRPATLINNKESLWYMHGKEHNIAGPQRTGGGVTVYQINGKYIQAYVHVN